MIYILKNDQSESKELLQYLKKKEPVDSFYISLDPSGISMENSSYNQQ